jgi:hypothetical protein
MSDDLRRLAAQLLAQSPRAMPLQDAFAQIDARRKKLLAAPVVAVAQPTPAPEPVRAPLPDPVATPRQWADDFWKERKPQSPVRSSAPKKPKASRGRRPIGESLDDRHDKFKVIEGGGDMHK